MAYGLLIDTEWCSGCHTCEMACQMHNDLPVGQTGIIVQEIGPWEIGGAERVTEGKRPTCVQHCQAKCMEYGELGELAATMEAGSKKVLYVL